MNYVVNEIFQSFQGEGFHLGKPCNFIRLQGCDKCCPWCDSAGTWHPNFKKKRKRISIDEIMELLNFDFEFTVLTGGEPTLWNLSPLVDAIHKKGMNVHIETAGHHLIDEGIDWITLSPKPYGLPVLENSISRANEIKVIVESVESIEIAEKIIHGAKKGIPIWLHPEWSKRNKTEILELITERVKHDSQKRFRAGWQIHKLYGAS